MSDEQRAALVAAAREVQARAYAPASRFAVGAAVRTSDGRTFVGCNVENASYGLTICAERAAICAAIFCEMLRPGWPSCAAPTPAPGPRST